MALTTIPERNNLVLKIIFSCRKNCSNCIEILFLRYILSKKTVKILPTSFGWAKRKRIFKTMLTFGCVSPKSSN
ncbi:hypothetical protein CFY87_05715 [Actinobacillus seminis]|uniref:Uncharacterized protein n=1 Tax=Actinobacillus seminis TaxID=722 RepID=A0ABX4FMY0_9PAST|nr:hypothetical protein CFY87_05715 [Actinobacillus seminis]